MHPITGFATSSLTAHLNSENSSFQFYKHEPNLDLYLSSIGIGTFKGAISPPEQEDLIESIVLAVNGGINVIDTAARYRHGISELNIGEAISRLSLHDSHVREKLFISSKAGLICNPYPNSSVNDYIQSELIPCTGLSDKCFYDNTFCLEPLFLEHQLQLSLARMNLTTLDCFYLHNPETVFLYNNISDSYSLLRQAFFALESFRASGHIRSYGISSWNGFRRDKLSCFRLDIERLLSFAVDAGGMNHGFHFVQLPISVGMPYVLKHSIPEYLRSLGFSLMSSASAYEGNLSSLETLSKCFNSYGLSDSPNETHPAEVSFPKSENSLIQLFDTLNSFRRLGLSLSEFLNTICRSDDLYYSAINIVRSLPEVTTALVGMEKSSYAELNLALSTAPLCSPDKMLKYKMLIRSN